MPRPIRPPLTTTTTRPRRAAADAVGGDNGVQRAGREVGRAGGDNHVDSDLDDNRFRALRHVASQRPLRDNVQRDL